MAEMYRIGTVQQVNNDYTCDVWFDDIEMVCEGMQVMMRGTRNRDNDLPNIDDTVCCLFLPPMMSDGIIIGCVYTEDDELPTDSIETWMKVFPDGSIIMYKDGEITIKSTKKVNISSPEITINAETILNINSATANIKATTINLNGEVMINDKPYKAHMHQVGTYVDKDKAPISGTSGGVV